MYRRYPIGYHKGMDAATLIRRVREEQGLSLRDLAARAGTSHSALAAYEAGRKVPTVDTLDRIVRAAGFELTAQLAPAVGGADPAARGRELIEVLDLAAMFPARVSPTLDAPVFGPVFGRALVSVG
jgi:transcriptional regulator with XRE-family HTH domain